MAIRKAVAEKITKMAKNYISKGKVGNRLRRVTEAGKKSADEGEAVLRKIKRRDKLVGTLTGVGAVAAYDQYKKSPYKVSIGISKKESPSKPTATASTTSTTSDYKTKAAAVTQARKEQVAANKQKTKANTQMTKATTNKEKVAANKTKVAANARMVAANKKKVAANAARYKKS